MKSVLPILIVAVKPISAPLMFCSRNIKSSFRSPSVIAKSSAFRRGLFDVIVGQLFIGTPLELSSGEKVRIAISAVLNVIPVSGTTLFELSSIELIRSPTNTVSSLPKKSIGLRVNIILSLSIFPVKGILAPLVSFFLK